MFGPDKPFYLDSIRADGDRFVASLRQASGPPVPRVPSCPDWNAGQLLVHLGAVHRHVAHRVRNREREFMHYSEPQWDAILGLEPDLARWLDEPPQNEPIPPELFTWFEQGVENLLTALAAVEPEERIGTWWPPNQTAGFWQRRMAQETAVHRWDTEAVTGSPGSIDATLARDGIDEVFDVMVPRWREGEELPPSRGESYHFHRTDGEGEWVIRFDLEGISVTHEHAKADVAVRGTASNLLLFLWGRIPKERLDVAGDASLLDRYFELVPPG